MCHLGVSLHCSSFWGWNPPKTPIFGAWIGVFKPNWKKYRKFHVIDFDQIFHNDGDHQVVVVGGPNRRPTKPRWRTATILKKNLLNRHNSAIVCRFWWDLVQWRILDPYSGSIVKISNFWKSKMAAATILKITKISISTEQFDRSLRNLVRWCKMGLLTSQTVKKLNFKNPRWRTAAILKTVKSPYLCNLLACQEVTGITELCCRQNENDIPIKDDTVAENWAKN